MSRTGPTGYWPAPPRRWPRPAAGDLILVCHGHISRALTVRWIGLPIADGALVAMDPAGVTVLGMSAGHRMIQHANVITHSGGPW